VAEVGFQISDSNKKAAIYDIKIMLLLRICFVCPSSTVETNTGVWLFYSANQSKKTITDVNYPVGEVFGFLYLRDYIDGYTGQPYKSIDEYRWMLSHARWRDL
jgi:hypothetical protein